MSLFSSIQLANNALRAQQIGLQVAGQNISNANTPGYIREEVVYSPAATQKVGSLNLGLGVQVDGIVQKIDNFLEIRLRSAVSDREGSEVEEQTYKQLEAVIGELNDTDISTSLSNFFAAVNDVVEQPQDATARNLAVLQGRTLADDIRRLSGRVQDIRIDADKQIESTAVDINRLLEEIANLNVRIVVTEGGGTSNSDAVGLRDQRHIALSKLAELIDVRVNEQPEGDVSIFSKGEMIVADGNFSEVEASFDSIDGLRTTTIRLKDNNAPLDVSSGKLAGLISSRDQIAGNFLKELDSFSEALIFEFNKIYSSGQGLDGYQSVTAVTSINDSSVALDAAGLDFTPVNGSFKIHLKNTQTQTSKEETILIDLNGLDEDITLDDLRAAIDAIDGVNASVSTSGFLSIATESSDQELWFSDDTSGVLASLGINTFFTGSKASDISINQTVDDNPSLFAASSGGPGEDADNVIELAKFIDLELETANGKSLKTIYDEMTGGVIQSSSVATSVADGFRIFEQTLKGQSLAISGVSLDEEAVRMISFQRAFQATARYISTLNELLDVLVNL